MGSADCNLFFGIADPQKQFCVASKGQTHKIGYRYDKWFSKIVSMSLNGISADALPDLERRQTEHGIHDHQLVRHLAGWARSHHVALCCILEVFIGQTVS